jgi:hypothetical protein
VPKLWQERKLEAEARRGRKMSLIDQREEVRDQVRGREETLIKGSPRVRRGQRVVPVQLEVDSVCDCVVLAWKLEYFRFLNEKGIGTASAYSHCMYREDGDLGSDCHEYYYRREGALIH